MQSTARGVVIFIVVLLAFGSGLDAVRAAEGDASVVPSARLSERPWRGITLVIVARRVVCTGFVVGERKVVTAAHCLTRDAAGNDYRFRKRITEKIRIHRAYSRPAGGSDYRVCGASRVWAHPKFIRRDRQDTSYGSRAHDYAVITTEPGCAYPPNAVMRLWATEPTEPRLDASRRTRIGGYPADPRESGMDGLTMWRTQGRVNPRSSDPRVLRTTGFVAQGMSGAPVWRTFRQNSPCGRSECVVGIVTECEVNSKGLCRKGNKDLLAVRITPSVKRSIQRR